ncbi:MAG: 3-hydroxyisobutyrate dehydrogenase [Actinomycetota bacterium]|nr:3-hydroxyisobutyrate dehydrogenase [Actinomycetota bacterium]MDQ1478664.1 3-hydroxyisobutyrate dehydrogenase [Actinomycetota bacterium]
MTADLGPVAVLGVGGMGQGMADSLLRAGIRTVVWDRDGEAAARLGTRGATVAATAEGAAAEAEIAITMVPDAAAVLSVALESRMLHALPSGAVWAQMSTIGVEGTDRVAAMVTRERPDVTFVDAPVSGTRGPAEQGRLTIFASGPESARARVAPIFDALGQRTLWLGPVGLGSRLKLVNNTLLAFIVEGIAESISLAHSLSLTTQAVIDGVASGPLASAYANAKMQRIAKGEYGPEYSLALGLKDVRLALEAADEQLPVLAELANTWQVLVDRGLGHEDVTVVTRALDHIAAS